MTTQSLGEGLQDRAEREAAEVWERQPFQPLPYMGGWIYVGQGLSLSTGV